MLFCGFSDPRAGRARLPKELKQRIASAGPLKEADERQPHAPGAAAAVKELTEYCAGKRRRLTMPIRLYGSSFQKEVWNVLLRLPYGGTTSYGRIAAEIGRPGSARAVGTAVGMNPLSIIVPCHRVLPASGALGNYGGGVEKKDLLLRLEGAHI